MDSPKKYLSQLRILEIKIQQKKDELERLRTNLENISVDCQKEQVQTSPRDRLSECIARVVDLEREIQEETGRLIILRDKIINEIQSLESPIYIDVLYKRYVEYKSLGEIAKEMGYSYRQILRMYSSALSKILRNI